MSKNNNNNNNNRIYSCHNLIRIGSLLSSAIKQPHTHTHTHTVTTQLGWRFFGILWSVLNLCTSCLSQENKPSNACSLSVIYKLRNSCQGIRTKLEQTHTERGGLWHSFHAFSQKEAVGVEICAGCESTVEDSFRRCWKLEQTTFWRQFDMRSASSRCAVGYRLNASQLDNCRI